MLPLEILDHILSYLDTDHVALKTCLRAHPVFSDLVKRYLYVHIVVLNEPTVNSHSLKPAQLAKLLLTNVCVADHVRSLHMTVLTLGNNQWQEMGWILPKFRQLEGISLTVAAQGAWSSVHKDVREAFMNCLRLPSTVEVSILRAHGFSLCAFADCGLKKLTLNENFNPSSRTLSLPYLESLSIHKGWPCLSEFFSSANIPKLRSLDFRPYRPNDFGSLPQLLQHCSNTLTSLELDFGINFQTSRNPDTSDTLPFSLSGLPHLERLILHANATTYAEFEMDYSLPVIAALARSAPQLKHLDLRRHFILIGSCCLPDVDWTPLNLLFPNSSLQRIDLRVSARRDYYGRVVACSDLFSSLKADLHLSRLVRQGVLVVSARDM